MQNKAKLFGIYLPIYALVALSTVVMRTLALFLHFNENTGYFDEKTLIYVSNGILAAAAIFFITYIFVSDRSLTLIPDFTSAATYVPVGIMAVATLFMTVSLFIRSGKIAGYISELKKIATPSSLEKIPSQRLILIIVIAAAIFAILSIVHLALTALIESHSSTKRANFGLCTVLFFSLYSLYLYFSSELPINAPNKQLDQFAYLLTAVFFLYETRLSFGRERWRHYIAFGFIASLVTAYSAFPSLIFYFATGTVTQNTVYELALTVAAFIFITSRVFLTGSLIENKESNTALALIKNHEARDKQINPIPERPEVIDIEGVAIDAEDADSEEDGNQISLGDEELGITSEPQSNNGTDEKAEGPSIENEAPTNSES
jgi:hypothetical protein